MSRSKRTHLHTSIYDSDDSTKHAKSILTATPSPLDLSKRSINNSDSANTHPPSSISSGYSDMGIYSDYSEDDDDDQTIEKKHEDILKSMFMDFKREMSKVSSTSSPNRRNGINGRRNDRYSTDDLSSSSSSDSDFFNDDGGEEDDNDEDSMPSIRTAGNKKVAHINANSRKVGKATPPMKKSKLVETKFCMHVLFTIMNFYMETGCDKVRTQSFVLNLSRENLINEATTLKFMESFKTMKVFFEDSLVPCIQSMYKKLRNSKGFAPGADNGEDGNYCRELVGMGGNMLATALPNEWMLLNPENKFKTNFRNIERIGEGAFGKVFKAVNVLDGNTYAIKLVTFKASFNHNDESKIFKILREVNALAKLDHINVLRYYTCWVEIKESSFVPFGGEAHPHHRHHGGPNTYGSNDSGDSQGRQLLVQNIRFPRKNQPLIENISSESSINSCGDDEEDTTDEDEIEEIDEDDDEEEEEWDDDEIYTEEEEEEEENDDDEEEEVEVIEEEEEEEIDELDEIDEDEKLKKVYDIEDDDIEFIEEEEEEEKIDNSVEITDDFSSDEDDNAECKQLVLYNHKSHKENSSGNSYNDSRHHINNNNNNNNSSLIGSELKFKCILYIQTQYCSGKTLRSLLDDPDWHVSHSQMFPIFHQILLGLEHIHDKGIIHRDLKPANIFLDIVPGTNTYIVKIGDFGLAKVIENHGLQSDTVSNSSDSDCYGSGYSSTDGRSSGAPSFSRAIAVRNGSLLSNTSHTTMVGTVPYISPEQMSQHEYTTKSDIYSLGIILFEMYNKFSTGSERAFAIRNLRMSGEPSAEMKAEYPLQAELVSMMIAADQNVRPSAKELLVHRNVRELLASSRSAEDLEQEVIRLRELLAQKDKLIESLMQQKQQGETK